MWDAEIEYQGLTTQVRGALDAAGLIQHAFAFEAAADTYADKIMAGLENGLGDMFDETYWSAMLHKLLRNANQAGIYSGMWALMPLDEPCSACAQEAVAEELSDITEED